MQDGRQNILDEQIEKLKKKMNEREKKWFLNFHSEYPSSIQLSYQTCSAGRSAMFKPSVDTLIEFVVMW